MSLERKSLTVRLSYAVHKPKVLSKPQPLKIVVFAWLRAMAMENPLCACRDSQLLHLC